MPCLCDVITPRSVSQELTTIDLISKLCSDSHLCLGTPPRMATQMQRSKDFSTMGRLLREPTFFTRKEFGIGMT